VTQEQDKGMRDDDLAGFQAALSCRAILIEKSLSALIDKAEAAAASAGQKRLIAAMRHATLGGGKRIRPFLVLETAAQLSGSSASPEDAMEAALAVELIHCYSLVHDDLPSMDNDLMRRGMPTVHVAFDDATAILAGDALQTLAFECLAKMPSPTIGLPLVGILAKASGEAGMVGGQMLDLDAEGRFTSEGRPVVLPLEGIAEVQSLKTGAIIVAAVQMGALCGGINKDHPSFHALTRYAEHLGRAFQIADDIIDATGDAKTAGKAVAKDAALGKATFVSALGLEGARERLRSEIESGEQALRSIKADFSYLATLIRSMAMRKN
jgi:farnesyl diphosphate synthase